MYYYSFIDDNSLSQDENDKQFLKLLFAEKVTEIEKFLDHHLDRYEELKEDFINHTEIITGYYIAKKKEDSKLPYTSPHMPVNDEIQRQINKWIINRKAEFSGNVVIDSDILEVRTKLILLNSLGVIKLLSKVIESPTELAKFLTEIIESNETKKKKTFEAVRTDIRYIDLTLDQNKKSPNTKIAINKVNSILASYGLPILKET